MGRCERIDKNPIKELKQHLETEIIFLSKLFSVSQECAIVLIALISIYSYKKGSDCYFITIAQLASSISLNILELLKLIQAISELRDRNIIRIEYLDFELIEKIEQVDKSLDYSELVETSQISGQKQTYELTEIFINKIINL